MRVDDGYAPSVFKTLSDYRFEYILCTCLALAFGVSIMGQYSLHYHDLISLDDYMLGRMGGIDFGLQ